MVRCPQRFSCVVERAFVFCLLEFPQTGFLVKALCPLCQVEAWNVTAVTSHTPVENIWCLRKSFFKPILQNIPGMQEAESCGCLLHCRTAPWPDSPGKGENYFLLSPAYFLAAFNLLQFCKLLLSKCLLTGVLIPKPVPKSNHAKWG